MRAAFLFVFFPVVALASTPSSEAARTLYEEGVGLLNVGRAQDAAESLEQSLRREDAPWTRAYLALALARSGKCERARKLVESVRLDGVEETKRQELAQVLIEASEQCRSAVVRGASGVEVGDDRVMTTPSAGTVGQGRLVFSDYEVGLMQLSYGLLSSLELSLAATVPVMQVGFVPTLKWRFLNLEAFRMAVLGGGGIGVFYVGPDVLVAGGGGGLIGDVCLSGQCSSFLSFSGEVIGGHMGGRSKFEGGDWLSGNAIGLTSGIGAVVSVHQKVKLLFELKYNFMKILDEKDWTDSGSFFTFNYGIRVHGKEFSADIGFMRPFLAFDGSDPKDCEDVMKYLPIGYPWLAFTYQW